MTDDTHLRSLLSSLPTTITEPHWLGARLARGGSELRDAAVLMLFARGQKPRTLAGKREVARLDDLGVGDVDVLILQRAATLRQHAGQPAFPGGRKDPEDVSAVDAALREAQEEVGVEPGSVDVLKQIDPIAVPVSRHSVTPVVGVWTEPRPVKVVDTAESTRVYRVSVADLVAPVNRGVFYPENRAYTSPVFDVGVLKVWGFTAGLLDFAFTELGWATDWDDRTYMHIDV